MTKERSSLAVLLYWVLIVTVQYKCHTINWIATGKATTICYDEDRLKCDIDCSLFSVSQSILSDSLALEESIEV